jgi:heme/copper-type cytochrome/quinol oxidase subunit 2
MKKTLYLLGIFAALSLPLLAGAQIPLPGGNPSQVGGVIQNIIDFVTNFIFIVAVGFIIYAAYLYLTSSGEQEKVTEARKVITYAIVAIIIAFLARSIISFIANSILHTTV